MQKPAELSSRCELIRKALDAVDQEYYRLETVYDSAGIVRERVFCYELYHQMRLEQEAGSCSELSLNGEIDKRGHSAFHPDDQKNPDFVFHIPGTMAGNALVMEVKGRTDGEYADGCINDLHTIYRFISDYNYLEGVLLIYNHTIESVAKRIGAKIISKFEKEKKSVLDSIIILCKEDQSCPSQYMSLSNFIEYNRKNS